MGAANRPSSPWMVNTSTKTNNGENAAFEGGAVGHVALTKLKLRGKIVDGSVQRRQLEVVVFSCFL